ncbi:unnamed protein product [Rotaria sp. Silwood1]|nr:unnamed protein product [Rotaria sp. Silwood1]CAF0861556.1 unnamed protein product [Rotaria sp. Silwood1]CAF3382881.1 unnamed protein product [Rotaria sp. Silwood1]CAF4710710.1 unnamed protein product [Rotaria sp. Silwood1]
MASNLLNNNPAVQYLLQQADELTNSTFRSSATVVDTSDEQYLTSNALNINNLNINDLSNLNELKIEEIDQATMNQISQSLSSANAHQQHQLVDQIGAINVLVDGSTGTVAPISNYYGEIFRDPNPPQIIRRPPAHGPVTYRQNVVVRFLQPPPAPAPGPLIIKEVRPPQPPAPPPLVVRQRAPPLPIPPPLILRERPPRRPPLIPSQTLIKKLPPIPVPPRSVIIERFPALPPRPRDVAIERWLPYSKEPQRRKIITYRAAPPRPYPPPRNIIIVYDQAQANVVRSIQKLGVQPQNPEEYKLRYGNTLLDPSTLVAQAQHIGIVEDLSPPLIGYNPQYLNNTSEYFWNNAETILKPHYEYQTIAWENQAANNNNEQVQVFWTDPYEHVSVTLKRLGIQVD